MWGRPRHWHDCVVYIFSSLNWICGFKVSQNREDKHNTKTCIRDSRPEGHPSIPQAPGAGSFRRPRCTWRESALAQQNKTRRLLRNSTPPQPDLTSLKIPYKQVLLTGLTSEMAFFLFPGTHQELKGDSCSIDQSAIDSASCFDKLLGSVESLGWAWACQGYAIELLTGAHRGARGERTIASAQ